MQWCYFHQNVNFHVSEPHHRPVPMTVMLPHIGHQKSQGGMIDSHHARLVESNYSHMCDCCRQQNDCDSQPEQCLAEEIIHGQALLAKLCLQIVLDSGLRCLAKMGTVRHILCQL
uniref:Uncharacterized protein n=1 Tax=Arundo donax TaxID=35708 RepID=A0A0A9CTI9_ARUDO